MHKAKFLALLLSIIISVTIIQQSIFFRWFGYETIPNPITDEFDYVWQGLSLRQHGLPLGWSTLTHIYKDPKYNARAGNLEGFGMVYDGKLLDLTQFKTDSRPIVAVKEVDYVKGKEYMFFTAPFFEHPPLGGLIYSLGEGSNVKQVDQVKAAEFRKPALVMATVTAVLLFIFLYLITLNPGVAALAVIIYSTVPTYLLATRTAFLENAEPPFILAHLILLFLGIHAYKKGFRNSLVLLLVITSGLFAGIGFLTKEPALGFLFGSLVVALVYKIPKKLTAVLLISAAVPVILYFCWGLWLQRELFLGIFIANSSRDYFGALKPVTMLEALKFKNFPVDGWWIWGFLSFILISQNIKQKGLMFLVVPLFTHFLLILFLASPNYPWYLISMIPFLAACSAVAIWQIFKEPSIVNAYAFFLIPYSSSYYWGRVALGLTQSIAHYRWSFLIFTFFLILHLKFGSKRVVKFIWFIFLAFLIQKIVVYNQVFFPYLIAHWGNLPIPSLPSF